MLGYLPVPLKKSFAQNYSTFQITINDKNTPGFDDKTRRQLLGMLTSGNESQQRDWETRIQIPFEFSAVSTGFNERKLRLKLDQPQVSGQTEYRHFPLGKLLYPDILSGWVALTVSERTRFQKTITDLPFELDLGLFQPNLAAQASGGVESMGYSEQKLDALQEALMQANQYWALSEYVQKLLAKTSSEENASLNDVAQLFLRREQLRKSLYLLKETTSLSWMEQSGADPAGLWKQAAALQRNLVRYTTLLEQAAGGYEQLNQIVAVYRADMVRSLRAALQNDFRNHELLLKTGRLLPDSNFYSLSALFDKAGAQKGIAEALAFEVVSLADSLHQANDFANAYGYYEDAMQVLQSRGHVSAANEVKERAQASRLGLLRSYLQIASKAISAGNETLARSYQQKSKAFIQKHPQNGLVNRIAAESDELLKTYLRKANYLIDQKQYAQAIALLEEANALTQTYYNLNYQEQINLALFNVYRLVFVELVSEARAYLSAGELVEAERRLSYALDYQKDHLAFLRTSTEAFHLQNEIQAQKQLAAFPNLNDVNKPVGAEFGSVENTVLQMIEEARLKVWANEMDAAWGLYQKATDLAVKNHLDKKPNIRDAFRRLDQGMVERICLNNRFRLDDLMKAAEKMIAQREYTSLEATLNEAIEIQAGNQGCYLDASKAKQLLANYADLFRYQHDFQSVTSLLYSNGFTAAIPQYLLFDQQISQYHLERFGAEHVRLFDFVRSQHNPVYTLQMLSYHLNHLDTLETVAYIQMLAGLTFDWASASNLFEKAASLLAVSDAEHGLANPEKRVLELVGNDRRFDVFRKTYLRAMKQLAKQNKSKT